MTTYDAAVAGSVGEHLKAWRLRAKLSQEALGEKLGHERPTTVQGWEVGRRKPKAGTLRTIAKLLDVSDDELRDALAVLVGIEDASAPPRAAPRVAAPAPRDPLVEGFAEALAHGADRGIALALANTLRSLARLPALEPIAAPRRARAR